MADYQYGTYGELKESIAQNATQSGTVLVYIGTAPVNLVRGYKEAGVVNAPVKIASMIAAQQKVGISSDWEKFTLCEAFSMHFNNPLGNVGPIYVINVLDPDVHKKALETTLQLTFTNGRATILSDTIILDTLVLGDMVEGVDFTVDYDYNRKMVILTSSGAEEISGQISATFFEIDPTTVVADDIIGGVTANGEYSGLGSLQLLYQEQNAIANLIAAPGWSHIPDVYRAMTTAAQKINGHWDAFVLADMPIVDEDENAVDTISKAIAWKKANAYTVERSKVCWPKGMTAAKEVVHLSTVCAVEMLRTDTNNDGIPMETPGNKAIPIVKQYFGEDSKNRGYDMQQANDLTAAGITTAAFWGGRWVLWGDHTAAYNFGADIDPRAIFDNSIRMLFHITNQFQQRWGTTIDKPFTRGLKDSIKNTEQEQLDALVGRGALIGNPKVEFLEEENPVQNIMNGRFRWDIAVTPTPPLKSASVFVGYTDAGFTAYFEGGDE